MNPPTAMHPKPNGTAVLREQLSAVGVSLRREATWLAVLFILIHALLLYGIIENWDDFRRGTGGPDISPEGMIPFVVLGFLVPLAVWKSEEPSRRSYLWTLPVDRRVHTLAKSFTGWVWYMVAGFAYLVWLLLLATVFNGEIDGAPWRWTVFFVAGTIAYLIGSMFVLATDHPWRWAAGLVFGVLLLRLAADIAERPALDNAVDSVINGRYGLGTALDGEIEEPFQVTRRNEEGQQETVTVWRERPDREVWLATAALWLALGTAGVVVAASVHQER